MAPTRAEAPPPPGTGSLLASTVTKSAQLFSVKLMINPYLVNAKKNF
jgi:hypothetical protein